MPRDEVSVENSCCGVSNEPVGQQVDLPENGVPAKKFVAKRAGDPTARPRKSIGRSAGGRRRVVRDASRRARRVLQHAAARVAQPPRDLAVVVVRRLRRRRRRSSSGAGGRCASRPGASTGGQIPAARIAAPRSTRRSAIADEARALGRTSTICPRGATKPRRWARTRYGPGESVGTRSARRVGDGERGRRAERGDHRAGNRRALFVLDDAAESSPTRRRERASTGRQLRASPARATTAGETQKHQTADDRRRRHPGCCVLMCSAPARRYATAVESTTR